MGFAHSPWAAGEIFAGEAAERGDRGGECSSLFIVKLVDEPLRRLPAGIADLLQRVGSSCRERDAFHPAVSVVLAPRHQPHLHHRVDRPTGGRQRQRDAFGQFVHRQIRAFAVEHEQDAELREREVEPRHGRDHARLAVFDDGKDRADQPGGEWIHVWRQLDHGRNNTHGHNNCKYACNSATRRLQRSVIPDPYREVLRYWPGAVPVMRLKAWLKALSVP